MFTKRVKTLFLSLLIIFISSCNKDYYTVGIELYDNQFEDLKSKTFPVFSYQEYFDKVQTNNTSNVHLGVYNDNVCGQFKSSFISQLYVSLLQSFGDFSQEQENEGSLEDIRVINEEEQVTAVYLDLPFLIILTIQIMMELLTFMMLTQTIAIVIQIMMVYRIL